MKKIISLLASGLFLSTLCFAQTVDPIILKIGDENITRSEFEFSFNKNKTNDAIQRNEGLTDFVNLYINYKLKVQAAKKAQMDTLLSFKDEFQTYRNFQLMPYLVDSAYIDSVAYDLYSKIKKNIGSSDRIQVAHLFLKLPQKANLYEKKALLIKIDSLYHIVQDNPAAFSDLAKQYSEDKSSAREGGILPWIAPNSTLKEFEDVAYSLKPGEISKPFLSTAGYHIVKMLNRKPFGSYEEQKEEIINDLEAQGILEDAFERKVKQLINNAGRSLTREEIFEKTEERVVEKNLNLKYLIKEYYEGILALNIREQMVRETGILNEEALKKYFKSNKSKYKWAEPRFKGYLIQAKDKNIISKVKKHLKKTDCKNFKTMVDKEFNKNSTTVVEVQYLLSKKGDNEILDKLVFDVEKETLYSEFPYYDVVGKLIRKPKTYEDVHQQLLYDYQDHIEDRWIHSLKLQNKQNIHINEDVLNTVNHHN
ncbi:MAG: peptidylprolyl isomerase [Bacteroidaceae bacterium]